MNDLKGIIEDCNKSDLVSKEAIKKVIEIIGQEEWNDLYDRYSNICTTMGELIITLKGIPELEEENTKLKAYNEKLLNGDIEKHNKIVELEAQIEKMKCCRNCKYDGGLVCLYKTDCKNRDKWELAD